MRTYQVQQMDLKISRAEQFVGDMMYEMMDGDMSAIELMNEAALRECRAEALFQVCEGDVTEILDRWMERGF